MSKLDITNLDPFNLRFEIYEGKGYYFISNPSNYDTSTNTEEVDLGEWSVDWVIGISIEKITDYKFNSKVYASPQTSLGVNYNYNPETKKLRIQWGNFGLEPSELVIKFYSLAQQRDKTINELLNQDNDGTI